MISKSLEGFKIYLFGSSLHSSKVNDIDLLLEYDREVVNIDEALSLRTKIATILSEDFQSEIDICLLSKSENYQTQFIKNEKGEILPLIV